jgi:hypothetical protein
LSKKFPFLHSITYKVSTFNFNANWQESLCKFKAFMNIVFFSNIHFLLYLHHFFSKLERTLILMITRQKTLEIIVIFFFNTCSCLCSKCVSTLKIMKFENVFLTIVSHFYVVKNMYAWYIWPKCSEKYLYLKQSWKQCMKNAKFNIINQHMNVEC